MVLRRFLVVGLVVSLAGCGRSADTASAQAVRAAPSLQGTFATLTAAGSDRGAALVVSRREDGRPATTLWLAEEGEGFTSMEVPSPQPLYAVVTWFAGDRVAVMGAACPQWTSGDAPRWTDEREDNVPSNCGGSHYDLWVWDRASDRWDQVPVPELDSENGYALVGSRGTEALFVRLGSGSPELFVLHVDSGDVTPAPDPPATDGMAEARFVPCIDGEGGLFGLFTWEAEVPAAVEGNDWSEAVIPQGDGRGSYLVLVPRDDGWQPVAVDGSVESWVGAKGCGPDGIWGGRPGVGGVVQHRAGTAQIAALPPLPGDADASEELSLDGSRGGGEMLAVLRPPPDAEAPDGPRPATVFVLDDGAWRSVPAVAIGSGSRPFLNGSSVASLDFRPGGELELEARFR